MREYIILNYFNRDGNVSFSSERREFESSDNMKPILIQEYAEYYKDDSAFVRTKITALPNGVIDYELSERMSAVREMCELGHKVRANTKIRNRQPLRVAYVSFADRDIQDYMLYCDMGDYVDIIKDELNVLNVVFMDEEFEKTLFDYNLKPNFRALGPKGYGKQAQVLKEYLAKMDADNKNMIVGALKKGDSITVLDIPLVYSDIELEINPKPNLMSASHKVGAIVLDTKLDDELLSFGFVADFRSCVQNIRKTANLDLTDKIFLKVYCNPNRASMIGCHSYALKKDLLATDITFDPLVECDTTVAHKFFFHNGTLKSSDQVEGVEEKELDKEEFYVTLYKEA